MDLSKLAARITEVARQKRDSLWEIKPDGELVETTYDEAKDKLTLLIIWLSDQDGSAVSICVFDERRELHTILEVSVLPSESLESRVWVDEDELTRGGAPWL